MIEIEYYCEQPPGKATIAIFTAYLPSIQMRLRQMRLIRLKTGHLRVGMPSYSIKTPGEYLGQDKAVWKAYVEFSSERQKDFEQKVLEALKPYVSIHQKS